MCHCFPVLTGEISSLKLNPMVQTELSQLTRECNDWRETLRSHRDELHQMQVTLQQAVNHPLSKEDQTELEHLQNQLHIQLINIHDLKQSIKNHERKIEMESANGDFHEREIVQDGCPVSATDTRSFRLL